MDDVLIPWLVIPCDGQMVLGMVSGSVQGYTRCARLAYRCCLEPLGTCSPPFCPWVETGLETGLKTGLKRGCLAISEICCCRVHKNRRALRASRCGDRTECISAGGLILWSRLDGIPLGRRLRFMVLCGMFPCALDSYAIWPGLNVGHPRDLPASRKEIPRM
jgi:hypothetical protein